MAEPVSEEKRMRERGIVFPALTLPTTEEDWTGTEMDGDDAKPPPDDGTTRLAAAPRRR
jgi:hypothetical protein